MLTHAQHANAIARGALCEACPLYGCGQGPVVPRVVPDSDVLVVEESPSQKDVDEGYPLSGNSGTLIFDALAEGDVPHARTSTTSVTLCRPPGGHLQAFAGELRRRARATKGEAVLPETCCAPRLATDLREARPKLVLTLGSEALRAAARLFELPHGAAKSAPGEPRVATLSRQHGAPVLLPETARPSQVLLGTFHPRFIFAGNTTYLPVVRADVRRAATLALRAREVPGARARLLDWETPQGILTPSADVCVNVLDVLRGSRQLVTVDIETDGIHTRVCNLRCVGLGATIPGHGEVLIVIPWQRMDGRPWWTPAEQVRVGRALGCMENMPLSGHNLAFDSAVLLRHGFLRARGRHWIDSLVLHHNTTLSELPHDLGFVTSRHFDAPHWKDDADAKAVDGVTDYWLHKYCLFRGTPVVMADGTTQSIDALVRAKSTAEVLALKDGQIVKRRIVGWHKQIVIGQKWVNIRIERQRASANGIVCTPEHRLYINRHGESAGRWVEARDVRVGDALSLPERQFHAPVKSALLGTLLGDSSLTFSPSYRGREFEACAAGIAGGHTVKSGLAQMKRKLLPDLFVRQRKLRPRPVCVNGRRGEASEFLLIASKQHRALADFYPLLYDQERRRRLRTEVLDALGPVGLAWWFMDDGCRQNGAYLKQNTGVRGGVRHSPDSAVFSTQRYPAEDVKLAAAWFTRRYGATFACGDGTLRLSYKATARLAEDIAPYIFPLQRYKLPRNVVWPEFDEQYAFTRAFADAPVNARVASVEDFVPAQAKNSRGNVVHTRYCLDVEDAHNFFTPWGLVHNCLFDVSATMRLIPRLIDAVRECGTERSFAVDTKLGPIARDMGTLGLHFDEKVRRQYFLTLEAAGKERLELVRRIVGRSDFNPGSFRQVAHYLFQEKGLSPPLATTGEEWAEFAAGELQQDSDDLLDKAATNEPALLKLLDLGVDKHTEAFIEALLSYRGIRKCQSTYLGMKRDENSGQVQDVFRARGVMQTESHGPGLENLSILHPAWRVTGAVSGRWSSQPNCFDGDTEVLTRRGWVRFRDCEPETDEVAQAQVEDGRVEFVRPTAWVKKRYEGELLYITTKKQIDLCCTPDHRIPFQHRRTGAWTVQPASSWLFEHRVRQAGRYIGGTKSLSPALVTLLCATQADGSLDSRACRIYFGFSKTRKIKRLLDALKALGIEPTVTTQEAVSRLGVEEYQRERTRVYVPSHPITRFIRELLGPTKVFGDWILDFDRQTLDLMAEEVWLWDGCASRRSMFASVEKINADWVQIITMLSGRRAKVRSYFPEDAPIQRRVSWQVDATNQDYSMTTNASVERVPHNGFVWCVSVPSDTIITRKNGRVLFVKNCQNFPERVVYSVEEYRASKGKSGILNTRAQVTAPPGYVLVGADYKAVELRLYAVQSGDAFMLEALAKGLDPHALNYATMQSSKIDEVQKWYKRVQESDGKVKKYLRNIAKRFCIAEGELVLTLDVDGVVSETPIERVKRTDKVWDGVEWVTHDGVIFQGAKEVLFHDGLWATEDHEVFLEDGRVCTHGEAQCLSLCLARGGKAGRPLRFMGSSERGTDAAGVEAVCLGEMPQVSAREGSDVGESEVREVFAMPGVLVRARRVADVALHAIHSGPPTLYQSEESSVSRLRRAWYRVSLRVSGGSGALRLGALSAEAGIGAGPHQQQWALRAGEHSLRATREEHGQSSMYKAHRRVGLHRGRLAVWAKTCRETASPWLDKSPSVGAREKERETEGQDLASNRRVVRVYDILNAGPRRRFTASGRIVHNCFLVLYGGEREKLFNTMSADRNPDGSRSFPDLKPADVQRWWNNWHKTHPETKRWQQRVVREFARDGYVSAMIDGRKRFCAGGIDPNAACNHTIQSSAAAITNRALVALAERCPFQGWGPLAGPILQVHDFLALQVPQERQAEAEALLEECMPYALPNGFQFDIEQKSGTAWSDI